MESSSPEPPWLSFEVTSPDFDRRIFGEGEGSGPAIFFVSCFLILKLRLQECEGFCFFCKECEERV